MFRNILTHAAGGVVVGVLQYGLEAFCLGDGNEPDGNPVQLFNR